MEKWRFYVDEALGEANLALQIWSEFLVAERQSDVAAVFQHLHHFLIHATNADKILDPKPTSERRRILDQAVNLDGINLKPWRKLRNHLEHFDERLDAWIERYHAKSYPYFDQNIVTGTKGFPQDAYLRALDGHIFKFQGEDYDLDQLLVVLEQVVSRLNAASRRTD